MENLKEKLQKMHLEKNVDMKSIVKERRGILVYLVFYYIVSLLLFYILNLDTFLMVSETNVDSIGYRDIAESILQNHFFSENGVDPDFFRTPGYPLFLTFLFTISDSTMPVVIVQYLLSAVSLFMVYIVGERVGVNQKIIWLVVVLLSIDANNFFYHAYVLTESLFAALLVLAAGYWILYLKENRFLYFVLFSLLVNYALFTRPVLQYFNLLLILAFGILMVCKKMTIKHILLYSSIFLCFWGGWSLRNYKLSGHFSYSTVRSFNLLLFDSKILYCEVNNEDINTLDNQVLYDMVYQEYPKETFDSMPVMEQMEVYKQIGRSYIHENFGTYLIVNIKGMFRMLFGRAAWFFEMLIENAILLNIVKNIYLFYLIFTYMFYGYSILKNYKKINLMDISIFIMIFYLCITSSSLGLSRMRTGFWGLIYIGILILWRKQEPIEVGFFKRLITF